MNVSDRAEQLVSVDLDKDIGHHLLHLQVLLHSAVGCVWNVVHHNVQVHLLWLIPVRVEWLPHFNTVWMVEHLQNLQFSVLVPLVLEHLLDGDCFASLRDRGLEDNSKRAISNDLFGIIGEALLKSIELLNWCFGWETEHFWKLSQRNLQFTASSCCHPGSIIRPTYTNQLRNVQPSKSLPIPTHVKSSPGQQHQLKVEIRS